MHAHRTHGACKTMRYSVGLTLRNARDARGDVGWRWGGDTVTHRMGFRGSPVQIRPSRLALSKGPATAYVAGPLCFQAGVVWQSWQEVGSASPLHSTGEPMSFVPPRELLKAVRDQLDRQMLPPAFA